MNAAALAAALSGIGGGGSSSAMQMQRAPGPSLAEVLNTETITPLLRQPGMLEKLAQFLPVRLIPWNHTASSLHLSSIMDIRVVFTCKKEQP